MKKVRLFFQFILMAGLAVCAAQGAPPLKLVRTIQIPQVACQNPNLDKKQLAEAVNTFFMPLMTCHFDRFGLDPKNSRLFIPAENNKTVEVYSIPSGKWLHSFHGFAMPHNVFYRPDTNRIYITDGSTTVGALHIFDGTTYRPIKTIRLLPGTDSLAYDPATHDLYVTNGGKFAHLNYVRVSIINTDTDDLAGNIRIPATRLEHMVMDPSGARIFINITDKREIGVIDTSKNALVATWPLAKGDLNVALDLDKAGHRLFVVCRSGIMDVFDTQTGKVVATAPISKGVDDVVYDARHKRVYVTCAVGVIDVFQQQDPDHYTAIARIPTGPMGKNGILVSSLNRFYVGVPRYANVESKLLVYKVQ
ncbi:MAG TPA: YncE family protein [Candidatus Dormibacteraeota bacterium]|nr:YncE family protein [Candidatus Dormibacteraeota bacterium]